MGNINFKVTPAQSSIDWTGRKVTGAHNGTINIKDGTLVVNNGKLSAGKFVVDTTSIKIMDVADPATNTQFARHLASDDFFGSDQYPEALFLITSVKPNENDLYNINGDLTIKQITHPVSFKVMLKVSGDTLTASGNMTIDRTVYGMRFRSVNFFKDLGDTLIYNHFDLKVNITAKEIR